MMQKIQDLYHNQWKTEEAKSKYFSNSFYLMNEDQIFFWVIPLKEKEKIKKETLKEVVIQIEEELNGLEKMMFPIVISESGYEDGCEEFEQLNIRFETKEYLEKLEFYQSQNRFFYELLPHNKQACQNILASWKQSNRTAVVQPTGSGKTYLMLEIMESFKGLNKLILAPSNFILEQTKQHNQNEQEHTAYMTYQKTLYLNVEEVKQLKDYNPSLIILDEYHRIGAESWQKGVNEILSLFPNAYILGVTATPVRYLDEGRDMSEELFDSNIAQQIELTEAVVKNILPMPKYVTGFYEVDDVLEPYKENTQNKKGKKQFVDDIKNFKAKWKQEQDVSHMFAKYLTDEHQKFIVFFKNKNHVEKMKDEIYRWFHNWNSTKHIKFYFVTSEYKVSENKKILKQFEQENGNEISVLFAIDILNEGLHLPRVDSLILLRSTVSPNIYLQQIGRIITPFASKNTVIFDLVNNIENIQTISFVEHLKMANVRENETRKRIGLMKHDISFRIYDETLKIQEFIDEISVRIGSQFEERMKELEMFYEMYGHSNVPDKWSENSKLSTWVRSIRMRYKKKNLNHFEIQQLKKVHFIFDVNESKWYQGYEKLKAFYNEKGHSRVPQNEANKEESHWVMLQRRNYKAGKISEEKIKLLNELHFKWNVQEEIFEHHLKELEEFYQENEHCQITDSYTDKALYSFVRKLRSKKEQLPKEVIKRLEKIHFIWDVQEEKWETQYQQLEEYQKEHGNANIPQSYQGKGDISLGNWVVQQRKKKRTGKLTNDKITKLNKVGFVWEVK